MHKREGKCERQRGKAHQRGVKCVQKRREACGGRVVVRGQQKKESDGEDTKQGKERDTN